MIRINSVGDQFQGVDTHDFPDVSPLTESV